MIPQFERIRQRLLATWPNDKDRACVLKWVEPRARRAVDRQAKQDAIRRDPVKRATQKLKSGIRGAKAAADTAYSTYIVTRDSFLLVDGTRWGRCCTCGKWAKVGGLAGFQCGHWKPRAKMGTRYHLQNSHGQCYRCNSQQHGRGEVHKHEVFIVEKYGEAMRDRLEVLAKGKRGFTADELRAKAAKFTSLTEEHLRRECAWEPTELRIGAL